MQPAIACTCVLSCLRTHVHKGWQDMGSAFRVHASSELQPDLISVFEAEQLVLAPGTWAVDELALFGLQLNVQVCT